MCCCCCNKLGHNRDIFLFPHFNSAQLNFIHFFSWGTIGLQQEKHSRKYANAKQKCNEQKQQKQCHLVLVLVQHVNDKNNILLIPPLPCIQKRNGCGDDGITKSVASRGRQSHPGAKRQGTPGVGDGCNQRLPHNLNRKNNLLWYSHSNKSRITLEQIQGKILKNNHEDVVNMKVGQFPATVQTLQALLAHLFYIHIILCLYFNFCFYSFIFLVSLITQSGTVGLIIWPLSVNNDLHVLITFTLVFLYDTRNWRRRGQISWKMWRLTRGRWKNWRTTFSTGWPARRWGEQI